MRQDETPGPEPADTVDGELVDELLLDDETAEAPADREWDRPWKRPFLAALSRFPDISSAARISGVSRATIYRHRDRYPAFAEAWDEAWALAEDGIERVMMSWATTGVPTKSTRTNTRVKRSMQPVLDAEGKVTGHSLVVTEETTETTETLGSERSSALMLALVRSIKPDKYNPPTRFGFGQDPDAGPIRIDSLSEIDRQIASLGAELELLDRHRPVDADEPREITSQ